MRDPQPLTRLLILGAAVLAAVALYAVAAVGSQSSEVPVQERRVLAERFHFTPDSIQMKLGTRLRIQLSSRDTFHGFQILGTDLNVEIPARGKGEVEVLFEPEQEGVYQFVCSKRCGAGHPEMRGRIVVKP